MSETNDNQERSRKTVLGFVLLQDANFDWPRFRHNLKEDWDISFSDEIKDGAVVFSADDYNCACSLLPNPVPNGEAEACAANNLLWKDGSEEVAKHKAHVMIAVMDTDANEYYDPVDANLLFCKIASAMLKLGNTIGIYKNPTVFEKKFYIDVAEHIKAGDLPIPIMLHAGMYKDENGRLCGFTYGLRAYGKEEIEAIGLSNEPAQLYNFIMALSDYILSGDVTLKDGETVGFTDDQHIPVTLSPVSVVNGTSLFDGNSLKIGFPAQE